MNAKRREYMVGVLPKRRILMRHGESKGDRDTTMYTITPDHNIQSMTQGMAQALRTGEHLRRVIVSDDYSPDWRVQFYVSPYTRTRSMLLVVIETTSSKPQNRNMVGQGVRENAPEMLGQNETKVRARTRDDEGKNIGRGRRRSREQWILTMRGNEDDGT
ncbi:hypothetical protein JHK85_000580 [Glycine max]|nr:hypothetical protein JHK85_000580 [Glycine max]